MEKNEIYKRRSKLSKENLNDEENQGVTFQNDSMISKVSFLGQLSDVQQTKREDNDEDKYIKRGVICLRVITCLVLVFLAIIVSVTVVVIAKKAQRTAFERTFNDSAVKLRVGIESSLNASVGCAWTLSEIYTGHFSGTNLWPNITLHNFENQTKSLLWISRARAIGFSPMINNQTNRLQWEAYAAFTAQVNPNKWNVQDGIYEMVDNRPVYDTGYRPDSIYPYLLFPIWQISPLNNNMQSIMYNLYSRPIEMRAIDDMLTYKIPTLTSTITSNISRTPSYNDPSSSVFVPVFNETNIASSIFLRFSWQVTFSNILPANINGIICVLQDSTDEVHSFLINGPTATYVGPGDLHKSNHDALMHQFPISVANISQELQIEGVQVVTYTISIYPSNQFQDKYSTNTPMKIGISVLALFLITFPLFILYDCVLHYHLRTLATSAQKSDKIIQSLYPTVFRKRLFQMSEEQSLQNQRQNDTFLDVASNLRPVAAKMKEFLNLADVGDDSKKSHVNELNKNKSLISAQPIADQFPSVTIMFADIAGFTSWSSVHSPQEVFQLLESLFGQFDRAARKLGVFKVETIGDCYVAVCGLPDPRDDHPVVMAQFALECQRKFNQVASSLEDIDANVLRLRSGLHSGPITAGILRGEKSRFQLFGDTMNTASRMESTGLPTKVQISEQTAELLRNADKESWFVPREELVTAKGKGTLQTYWLVHNVHIKDLLKGSLEITSQKPKDDE